MTKEELKNLTKGFAVEVFHFLAKLEKGKEMDVITNQLLYSSSSVAVNYRAACKGKSHSDFLNKLKIVEEEADECLFWLEFIGDLKIRCDKEKLIALKKEANELVSIFSSSIKTVKSKINPKS